MSRPPTARRGTSPIYRISRLLVVFIYGFAVVAICLLAMAFFLRLFNANTSAPFVEWVYRATSRIMQPFRGIFPTIEGESGSVFDVSLLFAMFMYGLLAIGMHALIDWIDRKMAAARWAEQWAAASAPPGAPPAAPRVMGSPGAVPPQQAQPPGTGQPT
ncbi:MAG TPA: YggT family protein [Actinomycetota bacterium]|nr:YggT family protein [Actinomycetota bacterium]